MSKPILIIIIIVLNLAKEMLGIENDINDIDRSHRTGSLKSSDQSRTSEQSDNQWTHSHDPSTSNSSTRPSK